MPAMVSTISSSTMETPVMRPRGVARRDACWGALHMGEDSKHASLRESDDAGSGARAGSQALKLITASHYRRPEEHPGPRAFARGRRFEDELGPMCLGDLRHDCQAQTATMAGRAGNTVKPLPHPSTLILRNPRSIVFDFQKRPA